MDDAGRIRTGQTDDAGFESGGERMPSRLAHFRIIGRLGAGGMGVVYRAVDTRLGREVALKVLPPSLTNDPERRARFLREARSAAAINHPNIATVYDIGEVDDLVFIAIELVPGETLRRHLERGPLPLRAARQVATDIARGLAAAHDKGIVHRDLKPENVMITSTGLVKLLDFGLAKTVMGAPMSGRTDVALAATAAQVTVDQGRVMGTPEYMSPEQAVGEAVDVRSDVFSLGIVLYEMIAGVRPFAGTTTGAVLVAIARDAPPPLRERAPSVDEATEAITARCLAKSPGDRFASARELLEALEGVAAHDQAEPATKRAPDWLTATAGQAQDLAIARTEVGTVSASVSAVKSRPAADKPTSRSWIGIGAAMIVLCIGAAAAMFGASEKPAARRVGADAAVASQSVTAASAPAKPVYDTLFPCRETEMDVLPASPLLQCSDDQISWCSQRGRPVACCAKGLVALRDDGECGCPPGGSSRTDPAAATCPEATSTGR